MSNAVLRLFWSLPCGLPPRSRPDDVARLDQAMSLALRRAPCRMRLLDGNARVNDCEHGLMPMGAEDQFQHHLAAEVGEQQKKVTAQGPSDGDAPAPSEPDPPPQQNRE